MAKLVTRDLPDKKVLLGTLKAFNERLASDDKLKKQFAKDPEMVLGKFGIPEEVQHELQKSLLGVNYDCSYTCSWTCSWTGFRLTPDFESVMKSIKEKVKIN